MDGAQGEFGALWESGSLTENDVLLKSPKVEIPDVPDEKDETQEEKNIAQDLNVQSCFLTISGPLTDTLYNENLITNIKTEWIENETSEETSDQGNQALVPDDAVLLKLPKVEIPGEQNKEEETQAMLREEQIIIEQDSNYESCFLTISGSTVDTLYNENLVTNIKIEQIKSETFEVTSDQGNQASGDAALLKSPKLELLDEQDGEETLTMPNVKACFLTTRGTTVDTLYNENLVTNLKTERIENETSEESPDLENKGSGAGVGVLSTPTLPRGVSFKPDKTFICNDCGKRFDKKPHLIQHIKCHNITLNVYFNCQECDYRTLTRDTLERHLRLHDETRPHRCADCGRRFTRNSDLQRHIKTRHSVDKETFNVNSCNVCVYKTSSLSLFNDHPNTHIGEKPFSCSMCTYQCFQKRGLKTHMRSHTGEKPFSCSMCKQKFYEKRYLEAHTRVHTGERPFSCSVCGHKFSEKRYLTAHMRVHTGEKPFSCSVCAYTCSRKSVLNLHMRSHTGEKPFSCSICGHKFSQKSDLNVHCRRHTGEKPFSCSVCEFTCSRKSYLNEHMRSHTGEKPFSCSICTYTCSRQNHLKAHMRSHTGEKPFTCSICARTFSRQNNLKTHMRGHTGEKPFSCSICAHTFTQKFNLKLHWTRFHSG